MVLVLLLSAAHAEPPRYVADKVPGAYGVYGLTNDGAVVAMRYDSSWNAEYFVWTLGGTPEVIPFDEGTYPNVTAVSPGGVVTGYLTYGSSWGPHDAFVWDGGPVAVMPSLDPSDATMTHYPAAVNDLGGIAGTARGGGAFSGNSAGGAFLVEGCDWPTCWSLDHVFALGLGGEVGGYGGSPDSSSNFLEAFLWTGGAAQAVAIDGYDSAAVIDVLDDGRALVAAGDVNGTSEPRPPFLGHAALWKDGAVIASSPTTHVFAPVDANEAGVAVGWDAGGGANALVWWTDGAIYSLGAYVPSAEIGGTWLEEAIAVNDAGQVVVRNAYDEYYVLTPAESPDLAVTAERAPAAGGEIGFTATVSNEGDGSAPDSVLTVIPPDTTTYVDGVVLPGGCEPDPDVYVVHCDLGSVAVGTSTTLGFRFAHSGPGDYAFELGAYTTGADANPANDTAVYEATVDPLVLELASTEEGYRQGDLALIEVSLRDDSLAPLASHTIELSFDPPVVDAQGPDCTEQPSAEGVVALTCAGAGGTAATGFEVYLVPRDAGTLAIGGIATAGPMTAADVLEVDVEASSADVFVTASPVTDGVVVSVGNNGPGAALEVAVAGQFDAPVTGVSSDLGDCASDGNTFTCVLAYAHASIQVDLGRSGDWTGTIEAHAPSPPDPDESNNRLAVAAPPPDAEQRKGCGKKRTESLLVLPLLLLLRRRRLSGERAGVSREG